MTSARVLLDTGPLVAFLNRSDRYHNWSKDQLALVKPPVYTCEAVLSEACFLLRGLAGGPKAVLDLVTRGVIEIAFRLEGEARQVADLIRRYADLPMSLADACLVRMAEQSPEHAILTLERV